MRHRRSAIGFALCLSVVLAGCGGGSTGQPAPTSTGDATVNFVVTDTPPTNVTVLSFQVQITGAVLQPGSASLLPRPVTVDLAQLVSDTGFLASTVIGSGTYTSLTMTYADPQITIMNSGSSSITVLGQNCAAGATCTLTPALNKESITISSGIFPLNVTANSTTGLNLDLSVPDLLQTDLSVMLANGSSVNLSLLPQPQGNSQQSEIDDVLGTITQVSGSQIKMTTAFGDSLELTSSTSTNYNYPASECSTASASCLSTGQIVTADLGLLGSGELSLNSISYAGSSGSQIVKGLVLSSGTNAGNQTVQLLIQRSINASSLQAGQIATVTLPAGAGFAVGVAAYPVVPGGVFTSATDLLPGQELVLNVDSGLVPGATPAFNSKSIYLEPTQLVGQISSVNSADSSLSLNSLSKFFTGSHPVVQQVNVQTDAGTEYVGAISSDFGDLAVGHLIGAKGPLFNTIGVSGYPTLGAIQIRDRPDSN